MPRIISTLVLLAVCAPSLLAGDWPQWRGPQSGGVGGVPNAPDRWSATESLRWRVEVEGAGISSPVAAGNRVYVTTAVSSGRRTPLHLALDTAIGFLSGVGLSIMVARRLKRVSANAVTADPRLERTAIHLMDFALFAALASGLLIFGVLTAAGPSAVDAGLQTLRSGGIELARSLGRPGTNLSFLAWKQGTPHDIWIISTAASLASLALIPFLNPACSAIRMTGAVGLCAGVAAASAYVPWAPAYGDMFPTGALIILYSPVVAIAAWLFWTAAILRRSDSGEAGKGGTRSWAILAIPALLAMGFFVSANCLDRDETLTRRVIAFDATNGRRLWHTDVFTTRQKPNPRSTPTRLPHPSS
jgi:hypothetical protein